LRNIQHHLGTNEYQRLRIGVGSPEDEAIDHVLSRFRPSEVPVINEAVATAAQAAMMWGAKGIDECMNQYNGGNTKPRDGLPGLRGETMPANVYECMFLLDSTKVAGDVPAAAKQLHSILERHQAEILASRPWDERRLAYPMGNHKKGLFYLTYF